MSNKAKILIIDDDPNIRKTLSDNLNIQGYEPIAFATGKAALNRAKKQAPDVALIDLKLTDMPGIELMRAIKECCLQTECIVITGYASQDTAIEAVNLGAYSYVQKPYDMNHLLLIIHRAVEKLETDMLLREREERLRGILYSLHEALIMLFNRKGEIIFIHGEPELDKRYGTQITEFLGKSFNDLFPKKEANVTIAKIQLIFETGESL